MGRGQLWAAEAFLGGLLWLSTVCSVVAPGMEARWIPASGVGGGQMILPVTQFSRPHPKETAGGARNSTRGGEERKWGRPTWGHPRPRLQPSLLSSGSGGLAGPLSGSRQGRGPHSTEQGWELPPPTGSTTEGVAHSQTNKTKQKEKAQDSQATPGHCTEATGYEGGTPPQ